jgi:transcriptional regulator with XRE-family HTH domain
VSQPLTAGIGRQVARYRKLNRWSARQLAENTDGAVSRDTIANIENGRRTDLTVRQLLSVALALRVPPDALLVDLEHPLEPADIRFTGSAPAPLERTAPNIAVAGWLAGRTDADTTPAARWVTHVTALLADYLAATDGIEIQDAHDRAAASNTPEARVALMARRRSLHNDLVAAGVHLPPIEE